MSGEKRTAGVRDQARADSAIPPPVAPPLERVPLASLRPHPRNYRAHPEDQLVHLEASVREHGIYRNVVVAQDGTILAGHGVVEAARRAKLEEIPVCRLPLPPDDPRALRVLAADNTVGRFAEDDDRALTDLLREVSALPEGLLGTGFDAAALAALVFVTRPEAEIPDVDAAAEWAGLPGFEPAPEAVKLVVTFPDDEARLAFLRTLGVDPASVAHPAGVTNAWSMHWPEKRRRTPGFAKFVEKPEPQRPA